MATGPFDQSQQSAAKLPRDRRLARRLDCGIGGDPKQVNSGSLLPSPAVVTRTHRAIRDLIRGYWEHGSRGESPPRWCAGHDVHRHPATKRSLPAQAPLE